ncbi:OmpH family outer membrane protein [Pararhodobacter aggregans]|uniref:OmpH family outer membrane protein n=1 Tax=Pararhodobacter aggregans TaxID=404875 RepID=UPI003A9203E1
MTRLAVILLAGALSGAPVFVAAQSAPPVSPQVLAPPPEGVSSVPFRILDQDRLLRGSVLGQQILARIREAESQLAAENQRLFDQLAEEEQALTDARAGLGAEEFRRRADAFDTRVEAIRAERADASQALTLWSEQQAQQFFDTALPVLVQMMNEEGLLALLKPDVMILGSDWLDVTDTAIARLDAAIASGNLVEQGVTPPPDPVPPAALDPATPDAAPAEPAPAPSQP